MLNRALSLVQSAPPELVLFGFVVLVMSIALVAAQTHDGRTAREHRAFLIQRELDRLKREKDRLAK